MLVHRERPCTTLSRQNRRDKVNTVNSPQTTGSVPAAKGMDQPGEKKYAVAHAPSFSRLQDGHALVYIFHFPSRVRHAARTLCTPYTQQQDNAGRERGKLW
jgi:hypothetical protein